MSTSCGLWIEHGLQAVGLQGAARSSCSVEDVGGRALSEQGEGNGWGESEPASVGTQESRTTGSCNLTAASSSPMLIATDKALLSESNGVSSMFRQDTAAAMLSMVTSRVRGVASLGVVAWLVSVS